MLKLKCGCNFNGVEALKFVHRFRRLLLYSTSSSSSAESNPSSSLANYLVESLGFSSQQSLFTSIKLSHLRRASRLNKVSYDCNLINNANLVINFFKQVGFDESQIRKVIRIEPRILLSYVEKTLKPKIKILQELGISVSDLSAAPSILFRRLSPVIQTLRQVAGSDENVGRILKSYVHRRGWFSHKFVLPNVKLLEKYGIPDDIIQKHIVQDPIAFLVRTEVFEDRLIRIEQRLGISRDSSMFLYGFRLLAYSSEDTIESKFKVFKSFGWTQSDIFGLMRRNPLCLLLSAATIEKKLRFFMSKLGYQPAYLSSFCGFLTCSLEKRIVPRHEVLLVLKEKGLIKMNYSLFSVLNFNESQFVKKFVLPYEDVHEVYAKHIAFIAKLLTQGRANDHAKM